MVDSGIFQKYIDKLNEDLSSGNATEHTHRSTLETLLESIDKGITATNEPKHIECGAPDYFIAVNGLTIGYIEAKDIGMSLDYIERDSDRASPSMQNGNQLKRYRDALPNLILTNYTEFRWYVNGTRRNIGILANDNGNGRLIADRNGISEVAEMLSDFFAESPKPVSGPQELAQRLARLAHMVRDVVREAFRNKSVSPDVADFYEATRQTLVDDLSIDDFADMFAQTLAYGLFAARVHHAEGNFQRRTAVYDIPDTNPFLKAVFDLVAGHRAESEPFIGFVDDLSHLLANSDMEAILSDFGEGDARQDPIMHFYETFLAAYDPKLREQRGVYYTPEPVISYIVRSVDHLLRENFECPDGLADYEMAEYETLEESDGEQRAVTNQSHRVLLLDPACGTGSFLYAVIDHIREEYRSGGNAGIWNDYVREHLLPRIFGFELMMAPYAMAHLKLGMQLAAKDMAEEHRADWAYDFGGKERLGVYLTNSLENEDQQAVGLFGPMRVISDEANAAAEIKRDLPIMVVLGNPPYSGHSFNSSLKNGKLTWIGQLAEDYKTIDGAPLGERNPKWLDDDYVKFIRFGQWRIQQSGSGVLAFITNHAFLDNPTFRGMRKQLLDTFTDIYLLDLHGNSLRKEQMPGGGADHNVFDIRQGVAISIFVKEPGESTQSRVHHADLYGERKSKYALLSESDISNTEWELLQPKSPNFRFKPWDYELAEQYEQWHKITEILPVNSVGVVTGRDRIAIRWKQDEMIDAAQSLVSHDEEMDGSLVEPILYRPFDSRHTYYSNSVITRPRRKVMRHMRYENNLALLTTRRIETQEEFDRVFVSETIADGHVVSLKEISYVFPLYNYSYEDGLEAAGKREPNLSLEFTNDVARRVGLNFIAEGMGDLIESFGPEDAFHYIYAVFHSSTYRERYLQFLRADFPRVPLTNDLDLFRSLVGLGRQLIDVHLLRGRVPNSSLVNFPIVGDDIVERAHPKYYAPGTKPPGETSPIERGRVYISKSNRRSGQQGQYFDGVTPEVWTSRIGGYQPMDKWLKDRKGRALDFDDKMRYQRISTALDQTLHLTSEIDAAVLAAGMFG